MDIGARLRQTRLSRKRTIDEIASRTGLSRSYISQVETGKASPSIPSLGKLAGALDVPLAALFAEEGDDFACKFIPKAERQVLVFGSPDGPSTERKSIHFLSAPDRDIEFSMLELAPGYVAGGADHCHEGDEVFFVLKGAIKVCHGDREFTMAEGDSIHVNATIVHQLVNIGPGTAEVMVARTPAGFSDIRIDKTEGEA